MLTMLSVEVAYDFSCPVLVAYEKSNSTINEIIRSVLSFLFFFTQTSFLVFFVSNVALKALQCYKNAFIHLTATVKKNLP